MSDSKPSEGREKLPHLRVLIVSQYYSPEPVMIAPAIAEWLHERGHKVRVLTSFPNYPDGRLQTGYRQRWRRRELVNGVDVLRVPMLISHSKSAVGRLLNYVSYAMSSASARRFSRGADVVYVYATQMTAALGPWIWRACDGAPYVLHVQDLWPESITGSSLVSTRFAARLVAKLLPPWLRSVYRRSSAIVAIAPRMVGELVARGAPPERTHLVFNWALDAPQPPARERRSDGCVAIFAGNVGDMQDLETVVRAAKAVFDTGFRLRIVGSGVGLPRVRELSDAIGATNVEFIDRVPREEMATLYAGADFSLVTLKSLAIFESTIPSKFQASLAHGLPVISTVRGDVRELIEEHGVGITANPEDVESLARAFRDAATLEASERVEMSGRALELYRDMFSEAVALHGIENVLESVARDETRA